jgi:hypothetical protein
MLSKWVIGIGVAAVAASASAQDAATKWAYFEPEGAPMQAGVQNAQGAQLILKCDKPGKKSVYAVVVTPERLVPPARDPFVLPTEVRFDENAPQEDRWRFYDNSAVAIDMRDQQALTRFMRGLPSASTLRLRMYVERGRTIEVSFEVAGAPDAISRVYESCQDDVPG